jgi:hypothetical protein
LSVNKSSPNLASAVSVAGILSTSENATNIAKALNLPPVLKSLLAIKPEEPHLYTFFTSALISKTWIDPDKNGTDKVFAELIENLLSNKLDVSVAVSRAQDQIEFLIK